MTALPNEKEERTLEPMSSSDFDIDANIKQRSDIMKGIGLQWYPESGEDISDQHAGAALMI